MAKQGNHALDSSKKKGQMFMRVSVGGLVDLKNNSRNNFCLTFSAER